MINFSYSFAYAQTHTRHLHTHRINCAALVNDFVWVTIKKFRNSHDNWMDEEGEEEGPQPAARINKYMILNPQQAEQVVGLGSWNEKLWKSLKENCRA